MNHNKKYLFGVAVIAIVIALASTASACIVWRGKLTVAPASGTGRVTGNTVTGADASHTYCSGQGPTTAAVAKPGDSITYTVAAPASGDACYNNDTNKLATGTYEVRVYNPNGQGTALYPFNKVGSDWVWEDGTGCYKTSTPKGALQNTFTVTSGNGSLTNNLNGLTPNYNGTSDASQVCVGKSSSPGSNPGIFAPLRVVNL